MGKIYEEIYDYVKDLEVIDTHEHLPPFERLREKDTDVLKEYLAHYMSCDLVSAGLSQDDYEKVIGNELSIAEKWQLVETYWEYSRNTGYARSLDIAARTLYGVDRICRDTIEELNEKFKDSLKPGHFKKVLKEKSKIKTSLLHALLFENEKIVFDSKLECDPEFFSNVYPIDGIVFPQMGDDILRIEEQSGMIVCSFEDMLEAAEKLLENAMEKGAVALKSALAYQRSLRYDRVTRYEAEEEFNEFFKYKHMGRYLPQVCPRGKNYQDYMMHYMLGLAGKKRLTVQFHTGIQEGNGNILSNSDPSLMSNLFLEYPDVDFDIFHMSYPYQNVVAALAKMFPNVYIDMCWAHIISPSDSVDALAGWIDSVPVNKISAFGGDYIFVDGVVGHQHIARENVSKSLARKVNEGAFDVERAKEIAGMLFYDNPLKIFKLKDKI
jgi:glucuronate isomerase